MLETTMYVRCTHCGYDNSPEYRFCGMCGASLAHPPAAQNAPAKEVTLKEKENGGNEHGNPDNVHGPSFLGLAEDPKTEFHYLYEDEAPRSHAGLIFILILLIGTGLFGLYQWRHNGFPFDRLALNAAQQNQAAPPPSQTPAPAAAQGQAQGQPNNQPAAGSDQPIPTDQKPGEAANPPADQADQSAQNQPPKAADEGSTPKAAAPEKTEEAKAAPPDVPEKTAKPKASRRTPASKIEPAKTTAAVTSPDADLELAGERYLYGNGLPQNCTRAESSLRTAATHGNAKAQTVLGTMYATGHCVGRDLPTAYRWFARALHQEPNNSRISTDLQVLWRQMTAQEKQLATASGP